MSEGSLHVREEAWSGGDTRLARAVARPLVHFLAQETASGVLLIVATVIALVWANVWTGGYESFWSTGLDIVLDGSHLLEHNGHALSLDLWVNDALMVLFFFVVGMEIKTEMVTGELADPRAAALPAIAALGGMIVPALLYYALNVGGDGSHGWGIPMATDIAFAVGVLALLGPSVPQRLKLFLLTLAIADDIGAIIVIAAFYSGGLNYRWLAAAAGALWLCFVLQKLRVWYIPVYVIIGVFCWYATFKSGVHATIAGVALGLLAPATPLLGERRFESLEDMLSGESASANSVADANWRLRETVPVCTRLTAVLSPWTSFVIIPIFALANAGVAIGSEAVSDALTSPVAIGVFVGLVLGKPLGVTLFTAAAVRLGIGSLPRGVTMRHILGGGCVAGIGFTVALFVAGLAFEEHPELSDLAVIGVLVASMCASVLGWAVLRSAPAASTSKSK